MRRLYCTTNSTVTTAVGRQNTHKYMPAGQENSFWCCSRAAGFVFCCFSRLPDKQTKTRTHNERCLCLKCRTLLLTFCFRLSYTSGRRTAAIHFGRLQLSAEAVRFRSVSPIRTHHFCSTRRFAHTRKNNNSNIKLNMQKLFTQDLLRGASTQYV